MNLTSSDQPNRLGVLGIFIYDKENVPKVNQILSQYSDHLKARLGIPLLEKEQPVHIISLIFEGSTDVLGALTGKLGQLQHLEVKTLLAKHIF